MSSFLHYFYREIKYAFHNDICNTGERSREEII